mmetsp:Transcript_48650/g.89679  ORF Transcript_48650/g.89679 Transcript_48650/m.89679 type:complete len:269 (-) Transcript_48650:191-997(-)
MEEGKAQASQSKGGSRKGRQKKETGRGLQPNPVWYPDQNIWWGGMPPPYVPDGAWWMPNQEIDGSYASNTDGAAAQGDGSADVILDALSGEAAAQKGLPRSGHRQQKVTYPKPERAWLTAPMRQITDTMPGFISPEALLGQWVDSLGNVIMVMSIDAFDARLVATLSRPPRPDIHLNFKPITLGAGWQCGHSVLDPNWSSPKQLHWVTGDGRISVWVRPEEGAADEEKKETQSDGKGDAQSEIKNGSEASTQDPVGDDDQPPKVEDEH